MRICVQKLRKSHFSFCKSQSNIYLCLMQNKERNIADMINLQIPSHLSIMPTLKKMEIDQTCLFPADKTLSVRSSCFQVSVSTGRTFRTRLQRPYIHVTRIK